MPILLSLVAFVFYLLTFSSPFTFLLCLAINHPQLFLPQASFCFVFCPVPLKSSHLPLYFPEEYSESCLLFLMVASAVQICLCQSGVFVSRHCRCLQHIAVCLIAMLLAVLNILPLSSFLPVKSCYHSAVLLKLTVFICCIFLLYYLSQFM